MTSVLIVDDEVITCQKLQNILLKKGFITYTAHNGAEALDLLAKKSVELALLDIRMPVMDGLTALKKIKEDFPSTEVIMITAVSDIEVALECMKSGAYGYLTKPVDIENLFLEMDKALERRQLHLANLDFQKNLILKVNEKTEEVQRLYGLLETNFSKMIFLFVDIIGIYDLFLSGHARRVAVLAERTGKKLGLNKQRLQDLEIAGLLHDFGVIGLPEKVRNAPRNELDDKEIEILESQTLLAEKLFSPIERLRRAGRIIRSHLERFDGGGFPDGLAGAEIPLESRILCVANAYDELKHRRRFLSNSPVEIKPDENLALTSLKEHSGKKFDRNVVEKFFNMIEDIKLERKNARAVSLAELKEGMTLAASLHASNGKLLLSEGNGLSAVQISKIWNYHNTVSPINRKIYVFKEGYPH